MSMYVIGSEYDMDNTLRECVKLISTTEDGNVKIAFNNMGMVHIFLHNLSTACDHFEIDPDDKGFTLDVFVGSPIIMEDEDDEEMTL